MSKAMKKGRSKCKQVCTCKTADASQCHVTTSQAPADASEPSGGYPDMEYPGGVPHRIYDPPVPVIAPISGGISPGKMIYISGVIDPNAERFTVNLMCGPYDGSDIALHCDVRLRMYGNVFIRNSFMGGGWGGEERQCPDFPFTPNGSFEMIILAEQDKFKIAVNNKHLVEYSHRLRPLKKIDTLQITGDVRINQIRFQ